MSCGSVPLDRQLETYSNLVGSCQAAHREAMRCRDAEETADFGLAVLENLRRFTERWARQMKISGAAFPWKQAQGLAASYGWWLERSRLVLREIEDSEARGYAVDRADDFRRAVREVSLMPLDIPKVEAAIASLDQGRGVPLGQAFDGLRDHCG